MKIRWFSLLVILMIFSVVISCNQNLVLSQEDLELAVGESHSLAVQGKEPAELEWSSSNTSVATVDLQGTVKAVGPGSAVITVSAGGKTAACSIQVSQKLSLTPNSLWIGVGDTRTITAVQFPQGETMVWTADNPDIAQVDQAGKITGVAPGATRIKVSTGSEEADCEVTVFEITSMGYLALEETVQLHVYPEPGAKIVKWATADSGRAAIDSSGNIIALALGPVTVTAKIDGGTASSEVTIIGLEPGRVVLKPGQTQTIQISPLIEGEVVAWRSQDSGVAKVSQLGVVTAVSPGMTRITAVVAGREIVCDVTVPMDLGNDKTAEFTGQLGLWSWSPVSPDGKMFISFNPPFGGDNTNRAELMDLRGNKFSLPFAPCSEHRTFAPVSWRGTQFVYFVREDYEYTDNPEAAIYVYDTKDHTYTNIAQDFDWSKYEHLPDKTQPVFYNDSIVSVVLPDGLWHYDLGKKTWTLVSEFRRSVPSNYLYVTSLSPDFSRAAWLDEDQEGKKLVIHNIASGERVTVPVLQTVSKLTWSKDSCKLTWIEWDTPDSEEDLVVLDIASGSKKTIHSNQDIADFSWSQDSTKLAVADMYRDRERGKIFYPISIYSPTGEVLHNFPDHGNAWGGSRVGTSLSWVPGQDKLACDTEAGLLIIDAGDGKRVLIPSPEPSQEMLASEWYEFEKETGFIMRYTWLDNGNLAMSIQFGGRIPDGVLEVYNVDWSKLD